MCTRPRRLRLFPLFCGLTLLIALPRDAWSQDVLGSRVNGLMSLDFSDNYITPRGLHVEDQGVVAQPLVLVFWKLHASDTSMLKDVTLTTGIWNSFHSHMAGVKPSRWNEVDPILGVTLKFKKNLALDVNTTAFYTPTDSYATSGHAELKLTYTDTTSSSFSVNPYVAYWRELNDKATVVFDPATSTRGYYMTVGATPTVRFGSSGLSFDAGTYLNFVSSDFYQRLDGSNGGSGLAVFSVAPKVSVPVKFMGITHGAWTAYIGTSYYHLSNDGLLDGNEVLDGSTERKSNLTRFRAGVSVFF